MPPSPCSIDVLTLPILWSTQQGTRLILNLCDTAAKGEMEPTYLAQASPVSYSIGSTPYYGSDTPILLKPMVLALPLFSHAIQFTLSPIDLWALPETRLSHSMMDCLGNAFYSHCPKEARPPLWHWTSMPIPGLNAVNSKCKADVDW